MEQRLSLVTLGVADVAASRRFYERLGFRASTASQPGIAFFQLGGIALALWGRDQLAEETGLSGAPGASTLAYNCRSRADVDLTLAAAVAAGGRLLRPARVMEWGGYSGYFADPDGHPWEVANNPYFPLREDGSIVLPP